METPFFLLHGRDSQMPIAKEIQKRASSYSTAEEYQIDMARRITLAWRFASEAIDQAQKRQKKKYDMRAQPVRFHVGDRVMKNDPHIPNGKTSKFIHTWKGPYRIAELIGPNAIIKMIDHPRQKTERLHVNRLKKIHPEAGVAVFHEISDTNN